MESEHFYQDPVKRREDDHRCAMESMVQEEEDKWAEHSDGLSQSEVWLVFSLGAVIEVVED